MKIAKISFMTLGLIFIWSMLYCGSAYGETAYDYEVSAIYKYQGKIDAVDIRKNGDFSGDRNILVVAVIQDGAVASTKVVYLDAGLPKGLNEIKIGDLSISDNQSVFASVWNSISELKPMTNGFIPSITNEDVRIVGDEADWELSPNGKRILAYKGESAEVQIPSYLSGKHITEIVPVTSAENMVSIFGDRAEEITGLNIPDGITTIGPTAFFECVNIENELYLPKTLSYIGFGAFYKCGKMTGSIIIPENVTTILPYAFFGCQRLNGEIVFSDKTNYISDYSFAACEGLTGDLILPDAVTYIGNYAFAYCKGLTGDLILPDAVTYIGNYAFTYCEGLNGNLSLGKAEHIGNAAFGKCSFSGSLNLPEELKYIGYSAFESCTGLSGELIFPDNLEHIGDAAFNHCIGFTNKVLTIPASVKVLGGDREVEENTGYSSHLFYDFGKSGFSAFAVEEGNEYFCAEDGVLYDIAKTRLIAYPGGKRDEIFEIPEGVIQIDELAFSKCGYLKNLILPDSYVITNEIPENVVNQNGNSLALALYNYTGVEKVFVKETNPNYISINGILYTKDGKTFIYCPPKYSESVIISDGTEIIGKGAFYGAENAEKGVDYPWVYIPKTVVYIDENTLRWLNAVRSGKITIEEENEFYIIVNGKIEVVK